MAALVSLAGPCVGNPGLAGSTKASAGALKVAEHVFHQCGLSWQMRGATMEIAGKRSSGANRSLGFHCATSLENDYE